MEDSKLNATCSICGTKYHLCKSCQNIKSFQPWRTVCDTLPHYSIYLALAEYTKTKDITQARKNLKECNLSGLETFNENIKKTINEIMYSNVAIEEMVAEANLELDDDNDIEDYILESDLEEETTTTKNKRKKLL